MIPIKIGEERKLGKNEIAFTVIHKEDSVWLYCSGCQMEYAYELFEQDKKTFIEAHAYYHNKANLTESLPE